MTPVVLSEAGTVGADRTLGTHAARLREIVPWVFGGLSVAVLAFYALALSWRHADDFKVYRMGGQHVLGSGLYTAHVTTFAGHLLFTYTPAAAMLFWPLSHLSTWVGEVIWDLTNVAALAALIAVSSAAVRGRRLETWDWQLGLMAVAPVGLLLWPVRYGIELGQINVVLVLMIVVDLSVGLSVRGRHLPKGVLVGIAAAIKLTPLIFVPFLLATRQWRAARNAAVSFVVVTVAMIAVAPQASWTYFTKDALNVARIGSASITNNQTVSGALARAGLSPSHAVADLVLVLVGCAGLALAAVAYRRSSGFLGMLLCAATGLLISPISWEHHYVWCVPLLVWLVFGLDRPKQGPLWAALVAVIFMVMPAGWSGVVGPASYVRENSYVLATFGFMILVGVMLRARSRPAADRLPGRAVSPERLRQPS